MGIVRLVGPAAALLSSALGCRPAQPPGGGAEPQPSATAVASAPAPTAEPAPTSAPAPTASPAPTIPVTASEQVDLPAPGPEWQPAELERARGYVSIYFGGGDFKDPGLLRPLAAWRLGEKGFIRVFRRVDPQTGAPVEIGPPAPGKGGPTGSKVAGGALWYEWPSDGTQFYWVTSGSVVLAAEDSPLARGAKLARVFRPWALKVAAELSAPRRGP